MKEDPLSIFEENPDTFYDVKTLAQKTSISEKKVRNKLKQLLKAGKIRKNTHKDEVRYALYKKPAKRSKLQLPFASWYDRTEEFTKRHEWKIISILVIAYIITQSLFVSQFKQLPSPLYGGDYYYQLGSVYHISETGPLDWFKNANLAHGLPGNLPIYGIFISLFVWILGWTPMQSMLFGAIILAPLAFLLRYWLAKKFFPIIPSLLISAFTVPLLTFIVKYRGLAAYIMIPLFLIALYNFYNEKNWKTTLLLGLIIGISGLTHQIAFIGCMLLLLLFGFKQLILDFITHNGIDKQALITYWKKHFKHFVVAFLIAFVLAQVYWFEPIFVHHGQTLNDDQEWTVGNFGEYDVAMSFLTSAIGNALFNFSSFHAIMLSALALIGLHLFKTRSPFLKTYVILTTLITFHYFIMEPLMGTNLVPGHLLLFYFSYAVFFLQGHGLTKLLSYRKIALVVMAVLLVGIVFANIHYIEQKQQSEWTEQAKNDLNPYLLAGQQWILNNTDVHDVFLSSNELSFALHALTGRKMFLFRRAHNDKFLDFDEHQIEGAIMLYGNDTYEKIKLINDRSIDYLYWDWYWQESEYRFQDGKAIDTFDPIVVRYTPERERILLDHGINTQKKHTWLDPTSKSEHVKTMDLLFVTPENYRSAAHPWTADLDPYLNLQWEFSANNQTYARIYKIDKQQVASCLEQPARC